MKLARQSGGRIHSHGCDNAFCFPTSFIKVISTLKKVNFIIIIFDRLLVTALASTLKSINSNGRLSHSSTFKIFQGIASSQSVSSAQHAAFPSRAITLQLDSNLSGIQKKSLKAAPWMGYFFFFTAAYNLSHCSLQSSMYSRIQEWWKDILNALRSSGRDWPGSDSKYKIHHRWIPWGGPGAADRVVKDQGRQEGWMELEKEDL